MDASPNRRSSLCDRHVPQDTKGVRMMRALFVILALAATLCSSATNAKTRIVVLPPDAARHGPALLKHIAEPVGALSATDRLLVYSSRPVSQIAAIERPSDSS